MSEHTGAALQKVQTHTLKPAQTGLLQRTCACGQHTVAGGECAECRKKREGTLQRASVSTATAAVGGVPPLVHDVLSSAGQPLDTGARAFMEPRFSHDFSGVRVHTDARAAASARAVNALAYTVGRNVVFGTGQYAPETTSGKKLLAHELTHVVQQASVAPMLQERLTVGEQNSLQEREAETNASFITSGYRALEPRYRTGLYVARFGDPGHHIIEEAALGGAGFSKEERGQIEAGNVQRDYSQVGTVGNLLLLCNPSNFGGYSAKEHFDSFAWDKETETWKNRGAGLQTGLTQSPIDYISSELLLLAREGKTKQSLLHLGNAFHTVEDFFAHSNFVELIHHDYTFGKALVTGSFGPADQTASLSHKIEAISAPSTAPYSAQVAEEATKKTEPLSHSRIAKDEPSSHNHAEARRLAALVVQDLGKEVRAIMNNQQEDDRVKGMTEIVVARIRHYLRPPSDDDKWWERLTASDQGAIDKRLEEAEQQTPVTVNQCVFSPLRNLEASKDSNIKIPLGIAIPVKVGENRIWIQAGGGIIAPSQPLPLDRSIPDELGNARPTPANLFAGAQITLPF